MELTDEAKAKYIDGLEKLSAEELFAKVCGNAVLHGKISMSSSDKAVEFKYKSAKMLFEGKFVAELKRVEEVRAMLLRHKAKSEQGEAAEAK